MRLLDRYLLRELLVPLGFCLSGFLLLWVTSDLVTSLHALQQKNLLFGDFVLYYLVRAPEMLAFILPIALLLALLYALTNHARHHEITAIRAAGVSLWRLCLPYLVVGFIGSIVLFAINEYLVPDSAEAAEQIRQRRTEAGIASRSRKQVPVDFTNERNGRLWHIPLFNRQTAEMLNPFVSWVQPDGSRLLLYADYGRRLQGVWTFSGVREYRDLGHTNAEPPVLVLKTNQLAIPEFTETPEQIKSEIRLSNAKTLGSAKRADIPVFEIFDYLRLHPNPRQAAALYTKLHGRLAAPWTCLVVVLIAIPFGAASGRRNVFAGVAGSVIICFGYFVLQTLCLALGAIGTLPPWLAGWLPNIAFAFTGIWMTSRAR